MKRIPLVAALLAALAVGPARGDSPSWSNSTHRSDHGRSYHDRHPYDHHDHDADRGYGRYGDRQPDDYSRPRTPFAKPNPPIHISPQRDGAPLR